MIRVLITLAILVQPIVALGIDKGSGGGFSKTRETLKRHAGALRRYMSGVPLESYQKLFQHYPEYDINLQELISIIENVRYAPGKKSVGKNDDGYPENRVLYWGTDSKGKYIVAVDGYAKEFEGKNSSDLYRALIREGLHHYYVGKVLEKDDVGRELATQVFQMVWINSFLHNRLQRKWEIKSCGRFGTVEERLHYCSDPMADRIQQSRDIKRVAYYYPKMFWDPGTYGTTIYHSKSTGWLIYRTKFGVTYSSLEEFEVPTFGIEGANFRLPTIEEAHTLAKMPLWSNTEKIIDHPSEHCLWTDQEDIMVCADGSEKEGRAFFDPSRKKAFFISL